MKKYIATFYAYKSQAEFQSNKDNWILGACRDGALEDFESLENVKYDKLVGYYLESKNLKVLKNELESKAIEFKNRPKADGAKFVRVYVYVDDNYGVNMIAELSYDFSEK